GVFPREERLEEKGGNLLERNLQPVRARETAVDFAVDIEDSIALRHCADTFQVEGLRPDGEKRKDGDRERDRHRDEEKGKHPAPAAAASLLVDPASSRATGGAREKFHR